MQKALIVYFLFNPLVSSHLFAAGLDELSKKPDPTPATKVLAPAAPKPAVEKNTAPVPAKSEKRAEDAEETQAEPPPDETKGETAKVDAKPVKKSASSKTLENRLSVGTSLGWSIIKPSKGTWIGVGSSDASFRWRLSPKEDAPLYITGRYAPFAGVWSTGNRDYNTTLHGLYGGAEYLMASRLMGAVNLKANVELGYMLVYAKAQDSAPEASEVKKGTVNLAAGAGAEWGLLSNKVKIGPFVRLHVAGFSIINVGGSAQFVF